MEGTHSGYINNMSKSALSALSFIFISPRIFEKSVTSLILKLNNAIESEKKNIAKEFLFFYRAVNELSGSGLCNCDKIDIQTSFLGVKSTLMKYLDETNLELQVRTDQEKNDLDTFWTSLHLHLKDDKEIQPEKSHWNRFQRGRFGI